MNMYNLVCLLSRWANVILQGPMMKQFMDVFSIPEMTLLAAANDYFNSNDIEYDPGHLYKDVSVSAFSNKTWIQR